MTQDVKLSVDTRLDFFTKYYSVPQELRGEVDAFVLDMYALAEGCANAAEFESKFAASSLAGRFNGLLIRCTPVPQQLTAQQQAAAKQTYKELRKENGDSLAKDIAKEFATDVQMRAEEDLIAATRKKMIREGTFDEYTKASNVADDAQWLGGMLKKWFGKK